MLDQVPEGDRAFIDFAFDTGGTILVAAGGLKPFCLMEDENGGRYYLQHNGFQGVEDKIRFYETCRIAGAAKEACRIAVMGQGLKLDGPHSDDERAEFSRLYAEDRLHEHPKAKECLTVLMESDYGRGTCSRQIDRSTPYWPILRDLSERDVEFSTRETMNADMEGAFTAMLLPREKRSGAAPTANRFLDRLGVGVDPLDGFLERVKGAVVKLNA